MTGRTLPIFAVALAASAAAHVLVWTGTRTVEVRAGGGWSRATAARGPGAFTITLNPDGDPRHDLPPTPPSDQSKPFPPPEPASAEPPPQPQPPKPDVEKFPDKIGKQDGDGTASHDAEGTKPLKGAAYDQDQPLLSRDPRGPAAPGERSRSVAPPGEGGSGGRPGGAPTPPESAVAPVPVVVPQSAQPAERAEEGAFRPGPVVVKVPAHENGVETDAETFNPRATAVGPAQVEKPGAPDAPARDTSYGPPRGDVARSRDAADRPTPTDILLLPPPPKAQVAVTPPPAPLPLRVPPTVQAPAISVAPAPAAPVPARRSADRGDGGRPGAPTPAADRAQESDSEVDAFSKIAATVRQDGRVEAQFGRRVRTVLPRMSIPGLLDAALGSRSVTLRVNVGTEGNVTAVAVHRSSGSNDVDQPCLVAMYDWWFEPLKDKAGRPVPDVLYFTLNFR